MKNKLTLFFLLFLFKSLAQAPQSFNYQAIARDKDQKPLAKKRLNVDLKILRNGQTIYEEPHQPETATNGLFTLSVGSIYPNEFQKIDWSDGDYALKVDIGGAVMIDVPAEPLLSVPYALFAGKIDPANLQLKIAGNTLSIAGGNSVTLPPGLGGGDNWGDQSVVTGAALTGKGTTASPLNLAAGTTKGQVLKWNGNTWAPAADSVGGTGNGPVYKAGAGIEINTQQNEIKNTGDLDATDDLTNQSSAAGDVSGKFAALSVDKLKGQPLSSAPPAMGQVLKWDGNVWKPDTDLNTVGNGTAATGAPLLGNGAAGDPIRLTPGTAMGQVLKWDGNSWAPAKDEIGTTSSTATTVEVSGTGLSVSPTATGYTLANTGDTNAADDLTNTSQAGGDVQGIFSDLQIKNNAVGTAEIANGAVTGAKIAQQGATNGQVLKWNDTTWVPQDDIGGGTGDGWGSQTAATGTALAGNGLPASPLNLAQQGASNGQVLKWNGTTWAPAPDDPGTGGGNTYAAGPGITVTGSSPNLTINNTGDTTATDDLTTATNFGGDVSGAYNNVQINANAVGTNEIVNGSITAVDLAAGLIPTTLPPSGAASGDLSGTYPNPTVGKIQGQTVATTAPTDGQVLRYSATNSRWEPATSAGSGGWNLTGNTGTDPATNFIGTKDGQPISFRVNDTLRMKLWGDGRLELFGNPGVNTFVGQDVGQFNTEGFWNTAIGAGALYSNTTGGENTANGVNALIANTTGDYNTAIGTSALYSNTTGYGNTANGKAALFSNTIGYENTANGYKALLSNTTGKSNVAIGTSTLYSNTTSSNLVAVGDSALFSNTSGFKNVAIGSKALSFNSSGSNNTAVGFEAGQFNEFEGGNTFVGSQAGKFNIGGSLNSFFGGEAGTNNISGDRNSFFGVWAGYSNTTAGGNSFFGREAGRSNISGEGNNFFGEGAGLENTTGKDNCFLGLLAGFSNKTGDFNLCIGNISNINGSYSNANAIGFQSNVFSSNTARLGNTSVTSIGGQVGWSNFSDSRTKTAIAENVPGLAFIQKLRPVTYRYDIRRQNALLGITDTVQWEGKYDIEKMTFSGFLAQEVEQAARSIGYNFSGVDAPKNDKSLYGLRYAEFTVPLVKAVQEQQALIEQQRGQLEQQGKMLSALQARLEALEAAVTTGKGENR